MTSNSAEAMALSICFYLLSLLNRLKSVIADATKRPFEKVNPMIDWIHDILLCNFLLISNFLDPLRNGYKNIIIL